MPNPPHHADPFQRLLAVMAALRGEEGCPWDKKQTHQSLVPFLVEEAYELIEAIEQGQDSAMREELGDVLLQVVFHAQVASERGAFDMAQVAGQLADKLVLRHPHVFGGDNDGKNPEAQPTSAQDVGAAWHRQKMTQRNSALEGIPSGQPALYWARQVGGRAAKSGFEWDQLEQILDKIREELAEVEENLSMPKGAERQRALEDEVGDLLFATTQLARWLEVDPEAALRGAVKKFMSRYQRMENALHERKQQTDASKPVEWRDLWAVAKEGDQD